MDAFYRALGAAGGLPFEPSQRVRTRAGQGEPEVPDAGATANAQARESRTAIATSPRGHVRGRTAGPAEQAPRLAAASR